MCNRTLQTFFLVLLGLFTTKEAASSAEPKVVLGMHGYVVAARWARIGPLISGRIKESFLEEGKGVKAGEVLARLDDALYRLEVQGSEAQLKQAMIRFEMLKGKAGKEELALAQAQMEEKEANLQMARYRLGETSICAPFEGVIWLKNLGVGDRVDPRDYHASCICEIGDLHNLEVRVDVSERDIGQVLQGQLCHIQQESSPEIEHKGRVVRILPRADRSKGAVEVHVRLEMPKALGQLRHNSRVFVQFLENK